MGERQVSSLQMSEGLTCQVDTNLLDCMKIGANNIVTV